MHDVFTLLNPVRQTTPVVFSSPHSGAEYPQAFLERSVLDPRLLRSSEDAFVDRLFADAPAQGAPLLAARVPRAYVDLNRAVDELDPALIEGIPRQGHNPRIESGLGVIPRVVAGGRAIHAGKLTRSEAEARLQQCWHPYHRALRGLVDATRQAFGEAILIDCHSMPHEAIEAHARPGQPRPEVVLGDRYGAAADRWIMDRVEAAFMAAGFRVARNTPFAGAYIAQAYGHPSRRCHVIQVEIDRALYMDERAIVPVAGFSAVQRRIGAVIADLCHGMSRGSSLAAE